MRRIGKWLDGKARNALRRTGFPYRLARFLRDELVPSRRPNGNGQVAESPSRAAAILQATRALMAQFQYEEAAELLEREWPKDRETFFLGELLYHCYSQLGDWRRTIDCQTRIFDMCERARAESSIADFPYRLVSQRFYSHFGHTGLFEYVYKLSELGMLPDYRLLIDLRARPANRHLLGYWMRKLPFVEGGLMFLDPVLDAAFTLELNAMRLADGRRLFVYEYPCVAQEEWERRGRGPALELTPEDRAFGEGVLREMGVPEGAWFVAVHARHGPYRAADNVDISTYFDAFRAITERGGWVIRVGDPSMPALPPMERVVDYAHSPWKSERMDTFLLAACKFFVGCASGPSCVPSCFGVPVIFTNLWFFEILPGADQIALPRTHCACSTDRPVPFAQVARTPYALARETAVIERSGLYPRSNTAEEIREAVEEMLERLDGTFAPPPEYAEVQDRWRATCAAFTPVRGRNTVGWKYACRYRDLL